MTMSCNIHPAILKYIEQVESGNPIPCPEQIALAAHIRKCFNEDDIYTDDHQLEKYLGLSKYFPYKQLFPWEEFLIALWDTTYWTQSRRPRWKTVFAEVGRGAGKDGFLAFDGACMISPYNPISHYNVDICANNEEQATRPQIELVEVLETPKWETFLNKHYYHTKQIVQGRKNKGVMKGHTNNPKGRDGLRPGKIVFNEVHQYENYNNIKVFTTALGKVDHARVGFFTSNGEVSDGPLDDYVARGRRILFEGEPDKGFLPFINRLENKEQVHDKKYWSMSNPSLIYLPSLMAEIEEEYVDWDANPSQNGDFLTKRMGIRSGTNEILVTDRENIVDTNQEIPDLSYKRCTCGIDYAMINDWASVNLHFRVGDKRYDINHSWLCMNSPDLKRLKIPWRDWADKGYITPVDDVEINPDLLTDWIEQQGKKYYIEHMALDLFRYSRVTESLKKIGFDAWERKNVTLIRPSDIMRTVPVISSAFLNRQFAWGDYPPLRWAANNTKLAKHGKNTGCDQGNYVYAKIEAKSRKTDPFMALVASMVIEDKLGDNECSAVLDLPMYTS